MSRVGRADACASSGCLAILAVWTSLCHAATVTHGPDSLDLVQVAGVPALTRAAWLHVPKTGSSFGTTVVHYVNSSLPEDAAITPENASSDKGGSFPLFHSTYPSHTWFHGNVLWEKIPPGWIGEHVPIQKAVWDYFEGDFVGLFREPASRVFSYYVGFHGAFGNLDLLSLWRQYQGVTAKMLTGQAFGHDCGIAPCTDRSMVPDMEMALSRLNGFKFVGLTSEYDLSVCLFHAMFGGECLPVEFLNMRPTNYSQAGTNNPLEGRVDPFDTPIYETVRATFWSRVRRYDVRRTTCLRRVCPRAPHIFSVAPLPTDSTGNAPSAFSSAYEYDWPGRYRLVE